MRSSTPVSVLVGDVLGRKSISEAEVRAASLTVTVLVPILTVQNACLTILRVYVGNLLVAIFLLIRPAKPHRYLTHFCPPINANFESSCLLLSSLGAKVEFEPRNPLPFQVAKLVHHKGMNMDKLRIWPTFNLLVVLMISEVVPSFIIIINLTTHSSTTF